MIGKPTATAKTERKYRVTADPPPHHIFVIPSVDQRIQLAVRSGTKKKSAFHAFAEENVAGFRKKLFSLAVALDKELVTVGENSPRLFVQLIGAAELSESGWIRATDRRIFIATHRLTADDLPTVVTS